MNIETNTGHSGDAHFEAGNNRELRRKAFKAGIISYQDQAITIPCVIRDFSDGGVKLVPETDAVVPDKFTLTIPVDGQRVNCEVRWRVGRHIGATFVTEFESESRNARKQVVATRFLRSGKPSILRK